MPLFLRKKAYRDRDQVLAVRWYCDSLLLYLGEFHPGKMGKAGSVQVFYVADYYLDGITCYYFPENDEGTSRLTDSNWWARLDENRVEMVGAVCGRVDTSDPYDVNSYLKQALQRVFPLFEERIRHTAYKVLD